MSLSPEAFQSAVPLANLGESRGFKFVAIEGTPLDALVKQSHADIAAGTAAADGIIRPNIENLTYMANVADAGMEGNQHDDLMTHWTNVVSAAVTDHLNVARTLVAPAVEDLVTQVVKNLSGQAQSSLLSMEVKVCELPEFVVASSFRDAYRRYEEVSLNNPEMNARLPARTDEELIELMKTGSSSVDKQIEAWAAGVGPDFLQAVWGTVFRQGQEDLYGTAGKAFKDLVDDQNTGFDWTLAIFLFANKLANDVIDDVEMDLRSYERTMVDFRDQSAAKLSRMVDAFEQAVETNMLVKSFVGKACTVYGPIYEKWLEEGGSNELLYGNILSDRREYTVDGVQARAEEFAETWNKHCQITESAESTRKFARTLETIEAEFRRSLAELDEPETLANRDTILKLFRAELDRVRPEDLSNLYQVCLRLVARSRFVQTDAEKILCYVERAKSENPTLDIREAAALATIWYVADWIAALIRVENC